MEGGGLPNGLGFVAWVCLFTTEVAEFVEVEGHASRENPIEAEASGVTACAQEASPQ